MDNLLILLYVLIHKGLIIVLYGKRLQGLPWDLWDLVITVKPV